MLRWLMEKVKYINLIYHAILNRPLIILNMRSCKYFLYFLVFKIISYLSRKQGKMTKSCLGNLNIINWEKLCPQENKEFRGGKKARSSALALVKFHKPFYSGFGRTQNVFAKFFPHYLKPHVLWGGFHACVTYVFINRFY